MLKILLKSRLLALWASLSQGSKNKKKGLSGLALVIIYMLLGVYMLGTFSVLFFGFSVTLKGTGDEWAIFTLASLVASGFCLLGSVFTTKTQIFESKDNELLLSMPIPPKYILASRILLLLVVNFILESLVMLPCIVTYGIICGYTVIGFIYALLAYLLIPFLVLAVSAILAWIISLISSKLKNKSLFATAIYILIFGAYMYFCFSVPNDEMININVEGFRNTFIFYYIGNAILNGNLLHFLYFALCAIIPSIVTFIVISRSFIKIITTKKSSVKIEYKESKEKVNTPLVSLVKKEIKRFFSSTTYVLNSGMGVIMLLIVSILLSIKATDIITAFETMLSDPSQAVPSDIIKDLLPVGVSIIASYIMATYMISAPSISLENKNLWILQTLPIKPQTILFAKILTHIIICVPVSVISVIIPCIAFKINAINSILVVLATISMGVFTAYIGMFFGLKFPKFDWINEVAVIKQGMAVGFTMLVSFVYAIILSLIGFIVGVINTALGITAMIVPSVILCTLLHLYFVNKAPKDFEKLKDK